MSEKKINGRPSAYKKEYVQKLLDYFNVEPYVEKKVSTRNGLVDVEKANDLPTLAGFAVSLGVHRDTIHQWTKVHKDFSDAYCRVKDFQEHFMVTNGLKGLIDTKFGVLVMQNILNWTEKKQIENTDKTPGLLDAIEEYKKREKEEKTK